MGEGYETVWLGNSAVALSGSRQEMSTGDGILVEPNALFFFNACIY